MNEELEKKKSVDETPLDFEKLFKDLLKHRTLYYKVLPITFIVSAIIMLSIPNYYKCEVMLAPELSRSTNSSSLLSLAYSFGVRMGSGASSGEALFPTLYPDLMNNVDFKVSLFQVPVTIEGNKKEGIPDRTMSYYNYLKDEQKGTWWNAAINGTLKWLYSLIWEAQPQDSTVNPFRLTKVQANIVKAIDKRVVCDVDQNTLVITITVTDQNPLICATMADTVKTRLQNFITDYRTSKARVDLEYNKKLYQESKARYDKARQKYAEFVDGNQDLILQTVRQRQTDLENEMQLQYNTYTTVAAQLQAAEARVQEERPAFTTLQSATVPLKRSGPARTKWCLIYLFLAFLATTTYIFYKEDDLKPLLGLS
ncbi:MAG: chain-length determining protein [Prevotella sp.]|nr:chain-length determining protein [Prevotella sp.]